MRKSRAKELLVMNVGVEMMAHHGADTQETSKLDTSNVVVHSDLLLERDNEIKIPVHSYWHC